MTATTALFLWSRAPGAASGAASPLNLAKLGHAVVINYAGNAGAAEECLALVREAGGDGIAGSRRHFSGRRPRASGRQKPWYAYGRIDLLVNNAGVAPNVRADLLEAGEESFDRLIDINLKGPYFLTQRVANQMIAQVQNGQPTPFGPPQIVTITSISAYTASVNRGDYCVAKAGLAMMTALFAARLAEYGINVYEIRPGVIATDMTGGGERKIRRTDRTGRLADPPLGRAFRHWPRRRRHRARRFPFFHRRSLQRRRRLSICGHSNHVQIFQIGSLHSRAR